MKSGQFKVEGRLKLFWLFALAAVATGIYHFDKDEGQVMLQNEGDGPRGRRAQGGSEQLRGLRVKSRESSASSSELESGPGESSSSSSTSQASEKTVTKTVGVKTLICDSFEMRPRGRDTGRDDVQSDGDHPHITDNELPLSVSTSTSSGSSSTYKRYKFGLTNHFLTMPDVDERHQAKVYKKSAELLNQAHRKRPSNRKYLPAENHPSKAGSNSGGRAQHNLRAQMQARTRGDTQQQQQQRNQREEDDSDCDLSVLPSSSPDACSLLSHESHWSPLEQAANTTETSHLAQSSSSSSSSSSNVTEKIHLKTSNNFLNQDLAHEARLMPAGDAGLDAGRCNSKASHLNNNLTSANHQPADCYLDPDAYNIQHHHHHQQHQHQHQQQHQNQQQNHHQGQKLEHKSVHSSGSQPDQSDIDAHQHYMRKKMKLSGDVSDDDDEHDCASNGLLVRLSSIMYATFLVILGCILHVSELRQKSRNSSDHIYTTIVALLGIFWLLFLQGDLQRYKRYASKFILLETIFNDHHQHQHQQQQQQQQQQQGRQLKTSSQSGAAGLLALDPSARSTTSSSASLVNDRMSMNTEVIFKKTAYKMYEQQAAAPHAPASPSVPHISNYKLALGNPSIKYKNSHHSHRSSPDGPQAPRLVPAYKFLHGKMGANFYLKCGMAAFCFGHVIHEGLRFGQQVYFFATNNAPCRDSAALVAHLVTPLYSFYQLFMMFKYSNLVINRHKVLARFGLMHIIGTCVTFWFRTILEEAFEDFVHKMDYFKAQNKPIIHYLDPTSSILPIQRDNHKQQLPGEGVHPTNAGLAHWLGSLASLSAGGEPGTGNGQLAQQVPLISAAAATAAAGTSPKQNLTLLAQSTLLALMSSPMSATITPQIVRHLPDSYHCAQNTLLTTKSMNALPYLYPFTIEYNLLIAAIFLSLYFNIGKLGGGGGGGGRGGGPGPGPSQAAAILMNPHNRCYLACCRPVSSATPAPSIGAPASAYYQNNGYTMNKPSGSQHSSGASFIGSQLDLITSSTSAITSESATNVSYAPVAAHRYSEKFAGEYKSNFVVNADCHAANKGLFLGFFVLLVTLVTIVIFFVTINKPSHVQLGIKINLIQEATLTSLILIVTLAGYRQIMRLNQNPFVKNNITTDDVLMLIPLPFFFIHSLLSIRAETATLYTPHHLTLSKTGSGSLAQTGSLSLSENAASVLKLGVSQQRPIESYNNTLQTSPSANFMRGLPSGFDNSKKNSTIANNSLLSFQNITAQEYQQQQEQARNKQPKMDHYKLMTIVLNLAVMIEVLIQTNFIIDGLRRCSESRYLRFKKPARELITFAIILNITYWIVATFETKSVEQYKTEIDFYGPLPYMFISHTTLPVMLFYRYHSSVCLAEIWNRAYKPPKRR